MGVLLFHVGGTYAVGCGPFLSCIGNNYVTWSDLHVCGVCTWISGFFFYNRTSQEFVCCLPVGSGPNIIEIMI